MSGVNPTFATAINEFLTNITDINIDSIKNEYTDTDNIKILTDELINKGLSITKYNYNYYLNFCEEPYKIYSVMLLYILSYIFNNFKNFDDTIFSNLIDNIKLIHNYLKLIKYPKIIRDISNLNKLFENEDTTFISIYKNIDNKTIKNLLSLFIDKYNLHKLDLSMNEILNINKEFYIVIKLIICYLNPNDYFKKFTSNFKDYVNVKIYLQYFFTFLAYEQASNLVGAIKDIIETYYTEPKYNYEIEFKKINEQYNITLNDDIKTKFRDKDIIKTVKYFHTYLKNNLRNYQKDSGDDISKEKINHYYNNDYKYLLINRDKNIIDLLKEDIKFEYKFNIDNNSNYLLELSNKVINLNDKIYNLFGYITNNNEFKKVNDDHDDHINQDLSNAKLIIYKKSTTKEAAVPENKELTNLITEISTKLASKVDSTIAEKLIEPVCTNIKLKYNANSCYMDTLFVALFNKKHKFMDDSLYNLEIKSMEECKKIKDINEYYYYTSLVKQQLIKIYNNISMKNFNTNGYSLTDIKFRNNLQTCFNLVATKKFDFINENDDTGQNDIDDFINTFGIIFKNELMYKKFSIIQTKYIKKKDDTDTEKKLNNSTINDTSIVYHVRDNNHSVKDKDKIYTTPESMDLYELYNKIKIEQTDTQKLQKIDTNMLDMIEDNNSYFKVDDEYYISAIEKKLKTKPPAIFIYFNKINFNKDNLTMTLFENILVKPEKNIILNNYTNETYKYTLQSIILFEGIIIDGTRSAGHYICVFECNSDWYKYDDTKNEIEKIEDYDTYIELNKKKIICLYYI